MIDLKRNTQYLLDLTDIGASLTVDRQPPQSVRLEVEIVGNTVSSGVVNVFSSSGSGVAQYVLTDRTTAQKYGLKVSDGTLNIVATSDPTSAEIIVEDSLDSGTYWKIFVDDGQIGWEVTGTAQDDTVLLSDTEDSSDRKVVISDGQLGTVVQSVTSETFNFDDNDCKAGETDFTTISGITVSGISDGFIKIRAVSKMGQPVNQQITVQSSMPVRFYPREIHDNRSTMLRPGQDKLAEYKIMAEPDVDIQENDLVYAVSGIFGLTLGQVSFVEKFFNFSGVTHHTEAEVMNI